MMQWFYTAANIQREIQYSLMPPRGKLLNFLEMAPKTTHHLMRAVSSSKCFHSFSQVCFILFINCVLIDKISLGGCGVKVNSNYLQRSAKQSIAQSKLTCDCISKLDMQSHVSLCRLSSHPAQACLPGAQPVTRQHCLEVTLA